MGPGSGLVTRAVCWPHPFPLPIGHTGRLLRALLAFSLLFLAAHLTFQICLHTVPGLDQLLGSNCELLSGGEEVPRGSRPGGELAASWRRKAREPLQPCKNPRSPQGGWLLCPIQALPNKGHPSACL